MAAERGPADITASVGTIHHKAARLLDHLRRRGAGVSLHTKPWTASQLQEAAHRGSHRSAKEEVEFVCTEMLEFCAQGFWTVLPLASARRLPNLRLSPLLGGRPSTRPTPPPHCRLHVLRRQRRDSPTSTPGSHAIRQGPPTDPGQARPRRPGRRTDQSIWPRSI